MSETSDRRGFLRHLAGELARGAKEVAPALSPVPLGGVLDPAPSETKPSPGTVRPTTPARPAARCATDDELLTLALELGLGQRLDAVRALARRSVRLTPAPAGPERAVHSWLGGTPTLPAAIAWPTWNGDPLPFLAQIDLGAVPAPAVPAPAVPAADPPLPAGTLYVFYASHGCPSGLRLDHAGAVAVRFAPAEREPDPRRRRQARRDAERAAGRPLRLSAELTLPRSWSAPVEALELDPDEQAGWQELRRRVAALQDVALADESSADDGTPALHRLLGYPDERRGEMPLACEAAARGIDLADEPPLAHAAARELEAGAPRWRLLLQLTRDDAVGWTWGERRERLYLWIAEEDLHARDFSRVWAIPQ